MKERVPGIDFAADMLAQLNEIGGRLFLLGAKPGVAEEAGSRICAQYPNPVSYTHLDVYKRQIWAGPIIWRAAP